MAKLKLTEAVKVNAIKGRKADVIIIDEGLGNRANMNYYGPECIESAPSVFEGAPCFTDHPSRGEEENRPERSIWHKAGYYSNVHVETIEGKKSLRATLTFDETETGEAALKKAEAAINFHKDSPNADHEYVGISINAQGESEPREVVVDGEKLEANYVLAFVKDPFTSADMVTVPARGGRFLALLESISGVSGQKNKQEDTMNEAMKKIIARLNEATKVKTPELLAEAMKGITKEAEELDAKMKADEKKEGEDGEDDEMKSLKAEHEALKKKMEDIGGMVKDLHKALHGEQPETGKEDEAEEAEAEESEDGEKCESEKSVKLVGFMLKEAGLPVEVVDVAKLAKKPMKAIEAEIARNKKIVELATGSVKTTETDKKPEANEAFKNARLSKI